MKRILCIVMVMALSAGLSACMCMSCLTAPVKAGVGKTEATEPSDASETYWTTTDPVYTEPPTTEPVHSQFYVPGVTVEDMITYFNEIVLSMEYTNGEGDASLVQKWTVPAYYRIYGEPTDEDLWVLEDLFRSLNEIPGFPGIYEAGEDVEENLSISFMDREGLDEAFSFASNGGGSDGAAEFWYYNATNNIYKGRIGYRTDIDQDLRNSVLVEEIVNLLGISDTVLRSDSIVYQFSSDALAPSEVDWAIIKLLYSDSIQCGMDAWECEAVLRELYY